MADNLLRLKVDSQEYDSKIKRAAEGIQHFVQNIRESGSTMKESGILARAFLQELGNMETVATGTKQQLREMSNAITTLTQTYRELSDEEKRSGFGQELNKQIQILTERAGAAKDAMMDVEQSIKNAASDTRLFDQMAQGASVMTAGFQGLTGAGKMLGIEMGNDVEVIAKLQAAMAVTNSLTTIQTALQKQSALMQGVQAAQATLAAAAQTALTAATGNATIAQAAFNAVAKVNPYVMLGTAIAAVGAALWAFASASSEAKKKEEELAKAEEEAKKKADEQRQSFVNASAEAMNTASRLSSLQAAYKNANSEIEKTGILKQAQTEFKKLGIECKGVHDAQTLLIQKGAQVIELIKTQGTVAALSAIRMEKFKESFKMLMENGYSASAAASLAGYNKDVMELDGQITNMQGRIQNLKGSLGVVVSGSGKGGKTTKQEDTNYAADSIMAQEKEVQKLTDAWYRASASMRDGILKDLDAAKAKLEEMRNGTKAIEGGELDGVTVTGSKMTSINKTFRDAPVNFDSINTYISGVKDALKNADLGSDLYNSLTEKLKDAITMSTLLQELMERGLEGANLEKVAKSLQEKLLSEGIDQDAIAKWIEGVNKNIKKNGGTEMEIDTKTGKVSDKKEKKNDKDVLQSSKQLIGGLNQVTSGLQQMGIQLPEGVQEVLGVVNGLMTVIEGVNTIISVFQVGALTANTIALGALTAAVTANTVSNFIPFFSNGGIVPKFANGGLIGKAAGGMLIPGNSFSGDNLRMPVDGGRGWIGVNSGELILSKSQQNNLATALTDGGLQNIQLEAIVAAEQLKLVQNNRGKRTGRGEVVYSKRAR